MVKVIYTGEYKGTVEGKSYLPGQVFECPAHDSQKLKAINPSFELYYEETHGPVNDAGCASAFRQKAAEPAKEEAEPEPEKEADSEPAKEAEPAGAASPPAKEGEATPPGEQAAPEEGKEVPPVA